MTIKTIHNITQFKEILENNANTMLDEMETGDYSNKHDIIVQQGNNRINIELSAQTFHALMDFLNTIESMEKE